MRGRCLSATAEPAPKRALPMARRKAKTVRSKDGVAPDGRKPSAGAKLASSAIMAMKSSWESWCVVGSPHSERKAARATAMEGEEHERTTCSGVSRLPWQPPCRQAPLPLLADAPKSSAF